MNSTTPADHSAGITTQQRLRHWAPVGALAVIVLLLVGVWAVRKKSAPPRATRFSREVMGLLNNTAVQKDVKLSAEQLASVKSFQEEQAKNWETVRDLPREAQAAKFNESAQATEKFVESTLDSGQLERLKQLHRQRRGSAAWTEPATMAALGMSMDQKRAAIAIEDDYYEKRDKIPRDAKAEERKKHGDALRKSANEQWLNILTEEQKRKWQELLGTPFKGDFGPERGGWGPGGRWGGGGRGQAGGGRRGGGQAQAKQ